jgi:hypothetical protein
MIKLSLTFNVIIWLDDNVVLYYYPCCLITFGISIFLDVIIWLDIKIVS